jgi:hypothetical protein
MEPTNRKDVLLTALESRRGASEMEVESAPFVTEGAALNVFSSTRIGLETLPCDAMNLVLSFLRFSDFSSMSQVSRVTNLVVTYSSHLFMEDLDQYRTSEYSGCENANVASVAHAQPDLVRLDERSLQRLLERFKSLRVVELSGLAPVGDSLFRILNRSAAAKTIQSLSLNGVSLTYWCPDTLNLTNLHHLRITRGSIRVSLKSLFRSDSFNLKSLSIGQCSSLRDAQVADMVERLGHSLTCLSLNQCLRIHSLTLQFKNLGRLSLMGCFALSALDRFSCPALKTLDLSFCFRLDTNEIHKALSDTPLLEELILVKCPALTQLELDRTPLLRILNVNFCHKLHSLRALTPSLERLETLGCTGLEILVMDATHAKKLLALNLSVLPALTRLEVCARHLQCLDLAGCRRLDSVSLDCPALHTVNLRGSRTVALRFCKSVRRVILHDWLHRRTRLVGFIVTSGPAAPMSPSPFRTTAMVQ